MTYNNTGRYLQIYQLSAISLAFTFMIVSYNALNYVHRRIVLGIECCTIHVDMKENIFGNMEHFYVGLEIFF